MAHKKLLRELLEDQFIYGRLTVIREVYGPARREVECRCSCGGTAVLSISSLKRGLVKSCGCYRRECGRAKSLSHGMTKTPEYTTWKTMRQRTTNPRNPCFPLYGGRGIKVCEKWKGSFPAFLADMGQRPSPIHSIDRINVNGDYEPGNCRWATPVEQARNTRSNRIVVYLGREMTMSEAAELAGLNLSSVYKRIGRGLPMEGWFSPSRSNFNSSKHRHSTQGG